MVAGTVSLTTRDRMDILRNAIAEIQKLEVYVGITEDNSPRKDNSEVSNAELAYMHTHGVRRGSMINDMQGDIDNGVAYSKAHQMYIQANGSPLWKSPPRPIIEPAIENSKDKIAKQLQIAATKALDGDQNGAREQLKKVGLLGEKVAREWFRNPANGWPQNSPDTVAMKGSDRPLVDTGQLRKAITHVVGDKS
jgi:hypothetical protein